MRAGPPRGTVLRLEPEDLPSVEELIGDSGSSPERERWKRDNARPVLLDGYRGRPRADVATLREVVLLVGVLAEDLPEIAELDQNPVLVGADGAHVVDARVGLEPREPGPPRAPVPASRS